MNLNEIPEGGSVKLDKLLKGMSDEPVKLVIKKRGENKMEVRLTYFGIKVADAMAYNDNGDWLVDL